MSRSEETPPTAASFEPIWQRVSGQGLADTVASDPTVTIRDRLRGAADPERTKTPHVPATRGSLGPSAVDVAALPVLVVDGTTDKAPEADLDIRARLGEGGMGRIDLAVQRSLRREVAVKSLRRPAAPGSERANTLVREALFTGYLEHPNIVPVHQLGRDDQGQPLMVMKRVEGHEWRELVVDPDHSWWKRQKHDRLRTNLEILIQVCHALHFAHSRGIVHRDIKLENVMVGDFGEVYVVDWGLALRLDDVEPSTMMVGTPAYLAPEMLEGTALVTAQTDVYLLGATLHHILVGQPRHRGDTMFAILHASHVSAPYEYDSNVPAELAAICNKACAREQADRYTSAADLRNALEAYLDHEASIRLAEEANRRFAELRELAREDIGNPESGLTQTFTEARFGYRQALVSWPENRIAQEGLQSCLVFMIERELDARNRGLVESLIAELPRPRPDLQDRLDELRRQLAAQTASTERLRELEHDLDPSVGAGARAVLFGVLALGTAAGIEAGAIMMRFDLIHASHALSTTSAAFVLVVLSGIFLFFRDKLLNTRVSRQLAAACVVGQAAVLINHLVSIGLGLPVDIAHVYTCVILAASLLILGAVVDKRLLWATPLAAIALLIAVIWPTYVLDAQALGLGSCFATLAWVLSRPARTKDTQAGTASDETSSSTQSRQSAR